MGRGKLREYFYFDKSLGFYLAREKAGAKSRVEITVPMRYEAKYYQGFYCYTLFILLTNLSNLSLIFSSDLENTGKYVFNYTR